MNNKQKTLTAVMFALIAILLAAMVVILVVEYRSMGALSTSSITRAVIIFASVLLAAFKLISMSSAKRKIAKLPYRDHYAEIIGNAFSDDKKLEKRLFSAIDAYRSLNFAKAIKILNALFPNAENNEDIFCILFFSAKCYYQSRYYDTAVKLYTKAFELKKSAPVASNLGLCYGFLGDGDKALEWCKKAITVDPNDAYAYNNLGYALMEKGEYSQAVDHFLKAVTIKMNFEDALCNATVCYAMLGDKLNYEKYLTLSVQHGASREEITEYLKTLNAPVLSRE